MAFVAATPLFTGRCSTRPSKPPRARGRAVRLVCVAAVYTVKLQLPNGRIATFQAASDGPSIYDVAESLGIGIPASCKQGSCSACVGRVVAGKVSTKGQTCVPPGLAKGGFAAMCCARPQANVTILTHQGAVLRKLRRAAQEAAAAR